jgi:hypothetical protein
MPGVQYLFYHTENKSDDEHILPPTPSCLRNYIPLPDVRLLHGHYGGCIGVDDGAVALYQAVEVLFETLRCAVVELLLEGLI